MGRSNHLPQGLPVGALYSPALLCGTALLCGLILFAVAIQAAWFLGFAPNADLLPLSNYGQLAAALLCCVLSAYLYFTRGERLYIVAGFAFGGWFLSNTFWYLYVTLIDRGLVYPSVSDAGFLGFMLLMVAAISMTYRKTSRPLLTALIYGIFLLPGIAILWSSPGPGTAVALAYCLCFAMTMSAVVQHYDAGGLLVFAGVILYCATMLMDVVRELYFPDNIVFTLVGQLAIVSMCVLQLGLIRRARQGRAIDA